MRRKEDDDNPEQRESQKVIPVQDKKAEVGINLNTIFTALVLAGILWVGSTLESIRGTLTENAIAFTELHMIVTHLSEIQKEHISDYKKLREDFDHYKGLKKEYGIQ